MQAFLICWPTCSEKGFITISPLPAPHAQGGMRFTIMSGRFLRFSECGLTTAWLNPLKKYRTSSAALSTTRTPWSFLLFPKPTENKQKESNPQITQRPGKQNYPLPRRVCSLKRTGFSGGCFIKISATAVFRRCGDMFVIFSLTSIPFVCAVLMNTADKNEHIGRTGWTVFNADVIFSLRIVFLSK